MPYLEATNMEQRWDYSIPYGDHAEQVRTQTLPAFCCPARRSASEAVGIGQLVGAGTTWITLPCGCRIPVPEMHQPMVRLATTVETMVTSPWFKWTSNRFQLGGNGNGIIISSRANCSNGSPRNWVDRIRYSSVTDGLSNTIVTGEMHVPIGKLGQSPQDAFIFNGDNVFNMTRLGGPTMPIVKDLRSEGNSLVQWGSWHVGLCHFAFADGSVRAISQCRHRYLRSLLQSSRWPTCRARIVCNRNHFFQSLRFYCLRVWAVATDAPPAYPAKGKVVFADGSPVKVWDHRNQVETAWCSGHRVHRTRRKFCISRLTPRVMVLSQELTIALWFSSVEAENIKNHKPSTLGVVNPKHAWYCDIGFAIRDFTGQTKRVGDRS